MQGHAFLITAAGGNGTAIRILDRGLSRDEYAAAGRQLGKDMEAFGAEQAGFLIPSENHFEMGGGEFCGNAARAAAILLADLRGAPGVSFTMSGYRGTVQASVQKTGGAAYFVECAFSGLPTERRDVVLSDGQHASIVDLGGIVHVVIEAPFPRDPQTYQTAHRTIMHELALNNRAAVGVVWIERSNEAIKMHPVVWVKEVNTFFYEQSCGSGTIAVGKVTDICSVVQPTGKTIEAQITPDGVTLRSEMEVIREEP